MQFPDADSADATRLQNLLTSAQAISAASKCFCAISGEVSLVQL